MHDREEHDEHEHIYPPIALLIIALLRAIAASPRPDRSFTRHATKRRTY